jgi:hypothetical protein
MNKFFAKIFKEIKTGENLDLYLTILLAIVVAILGILQVISFEILSAAILATLGLLASSLLSSRRSTTEIKSSFDKLSSTTSELQEKIQKSSSISELLIKAYPDLTEKLRSAKNVSIEGSTLMSTVTRYTTAFEQLLQRGGALKILVSEAVPEVLAMQVYRSSSIKDPVIMANDMQSHVAVMKTLTNKIHQPDLLEIKLMPYLASYSLFIIEDKDGITEIYVKLLPFQKSDSESPTFKVDSKNDPIWYKFFSKQFELLWESAHKI